MKLSNTLIVSVGAVNAALAVIAGAFGAHGLEGKVAARLLGAFETGAQYHFYHALGLILVGLAIQQWPSSRWLPRAAAAMQMGIILFSGSLYALALTGVGVLGAITPLGGFALISSWVMLAIGTATRTDQ